MPARRGATLVEAALGAAILGTLLVAALVTSGRLETQGAHARQKSEACRMADRLLESWWQTPEKFPRTGGGPVPGQAGWRWRTRVVESDTAKSLKANIVALELFSQGRNEERPDLVIEVLVPEAADEAAGLNAR
jgi:hypothetical protein